MSGHQKPRVDEEDDLDDLDDVLDQFSPPVQPVQASLPHQSTTSTSTSTTSAGASASTQPEAAADQGLTEDFVAKLAEEMASLLAGIEPGAGGSESTDGKERERLAAVWEAMLVDGMDEMSTASSARPSASPGSKGDDFQSRIRSTMNKLKESESDLKSSDATSTGGDEPFESLLKQLEGTGNGAENEEEMQGVLEAMMGQLMSKDVLYEPLKELHDKFPGYLTKNSSTISPEDKKRFDAQIACIKRLLDEFEAKTYRDDDEKAREKIVDLMSELQTHGSPPEDIMGPLPPGFTMGADGLPNVPDGCNVN